jgi:hypothetical protein
MGWSGFQGGPGVSNFFFADTTSDNSWVPTQAQIDATAAAVTTFANQIKNLIAPTVVLSTMRDVDVFHDDTGELQDTYTAAAQLAVPSTATGGSSYSAASGAVIDWKTRTIRRRRRVQGRTFIVPLSQGCYEANGTLNDNTLTVLSNAAIKLVNDVGYPDFGVWARPTRVKDANGKYTGEVLPDGVFANATSIAVPDMAAVLRSRRN